jgi:hypothetical protein
MVSESNGGGFDSCFQRCYSFRYVYSVQSGRTVFCVVRVCTFLTVLSHPSRSLNPCTNVVSARLWQAFPVVSVLFSIQLKSPATIKSVCVVGSMCAISVLKNAYAPSFSQRRKGRLY